MARVCVLAFNSVVRDNRILKEADSLAENGHDVTIVGILDNKTPGLTVKRDSGVEINLQDFRKIIRTARHVISSQKKAVIRAVIFAVLTFTIVFLLKPINEESDSYLVRQGAQMLTYFVLSRGLEEISIVAGLSAYVIMSIWYLLKELSCFAKKLATIVLGLFWPAHKKTLGGGEGAASSPSLYSRMLTKLGRWNIGRMLIEGAVRIQPDIIHCHDLSTVPMGVAAKRKTGAHLIFDAHEIYEEVAQGDKRLKRWYKKMLRRYEGDIDSFITINDSIADFYAEKYRSLPPAVIIKNATILAEPFEYDGRLHEATELPSEQKILLYQGGFAEKRGLRLLVKAAQSLHDDWTLVMMGWGRIEPELREIANQVVAATRDKRERPAVTFIPPAIQAELPYWSAGGTIGIIPYERVGLNHLWCTPNKLWEYPNAGVPVLCSQLVEMTKMVEEHKMGWLLPENLTPKTLADTVNQLSDEDIERAKQACKVFLAKDNWSTYAKRLVGLYEQIETS